MENLRVLRKKSTAFTYDILCLRNSFAVPYLMVINFTFCFVSFYLSREWQFRIIYGLLAAIPSWSFLLCPHKNTPLIDFIWCLTTDVLKTASIALFSCALFKLRMEEELTAFFTSLAAVSSLVLSPAYNANGINIQIKNFSIKMGERAKKELIVWVFEPSVRLFLWIKWIVLLKWIPILLEFLHRCLQKLYVFIDENFLSHLRNLFQRIQSIFVYLFYLYWMRDVLHWANQKFIDPLRVYLRRISAAVVYVVKCYWLRPVMGLLWRGCLWACAYATFVMKRITVYLLSLTVVHILKPFAIILWEKTTILWGHAYRLAIHPALNLLYEKCKIIEDYVYIYVLGPLFKFIIESIPQRNPFCNETEQDLVEFIPETTPQDNLTDDERTFDKDSDCVDWNPNELSNSSSVESLILTDNKQLAKSLKKIAISDSDSDEDEFLPISKKRRSKRV